GRILWQKRIGKGAKVDRRNTSASCSPVTDGRRAFFLYGTGVLAGFDAGGRLIWSRDLAKDYGELHVKFGYAASPLLYKGRLYVPMLHRDVPVRRRPAKGTPKAESYLLAVDPATGKTLFRHVRPNKAFQESQEAYTTPIPREAGGRTEILIMGGDCLTGHDAATGGELWRWEGYNPQRKDWNRIVPSPVVGPGNLVFVAAPRRAPLYAVEITGTGRSRLRPRTAWKSTPFPPDVCTPVLYKGSLYVLDGDKDTMTCFEPETGRERWRGKLGGRKVFRASPMAADGKIYCIDENGEVFVLAAGDEFRIIARVPMGEGPVRSSITIAYGKLFIRTARSLYCIGK
ncbi:MAG: outer membrane protein assembly factor BamB family protein, partial [Planctomycetota bacterium]